MRDQKFSANFTSEDMSYVVSDFAAEPEQAPDEHDIKEDTNCQYSSDEDFSDEVDTAMYNTDDMLSLHASDEI